MINPPENLTLIAFKSAEGYWAPYALNPPGPSPVGCRPEWEWIAVQNGTLFQKQIGKKQFEITQSNTGAER
ncbi:MAG: hypothetical protein AAF583_01535 [Pseudomonadota bacterium]